MSKVAVVYWSGTGNTEMMAEAVAKGAEADLIQASDFSADKAAQYDAIAFGCPAMGSEELEDGEFAPMFDSVKDQLKGKKIALFGSYDWGDGEWMRTWSDECNALGAVQAASFVICNNTPDEEGLAACESLGAALK